MMNKDNQPFVSIVTPVYNGEKFLEECIASVLAQSYQNWEYIIVNNCSTDRSLDIAEHYAREDKRIRTCNNSDFLTSLQNFNHSLRQISQESKYCKIVHADDWIYPECIEKMVRLADTDPSVGIVGSYRLVNNKVESDGLPYSQSVFSGRDVGRMNLTRGPYTFGSPSALLIRADLIRARDKFYNEGHTGVDTEACLELLQTCDFGFIHQVLSFSRVHDQAITGINKSLCTSYPNFLYVFKKYGRAYLSTKEYEAELKSRMQAYYRFLGSQLSRLNDKHFWDFHIKGINNLGYSFSWLQVLIAAAYHVAYRLVDTKQNLKRVAGLFRKV
jgi:glycosyltransferase involved in cell wall biosynthesis